MKVGSRLVQFPVLNIACRHWEAVICKFVFELLCILREKSLSPHSLRVLYKIWLGFLSLVYPLSLSRVYGNHRLNSEIEQVEIFHIGSRCHKIQILLDYSLMSRPEAAKKLPLYWKRIRCFTL